MRILLAIFTGLCALAQEPAVVPPAEVESPLSGSLEIGYRWRTDVVGNFDAYRSVVDLGSGPKLLGTDFTVTDPGGRLFDRFEVHAANWGDDPYSTARVSARRNHVYEFSADYRNMAYFNALPSFANPLLGRGALLSERSFDMRRRLAAFHLELAPGSRIVPYAAYERSSGFGRGVTTFVAEANEYPVPTRLRDANDIYRAGARLNFGRFHATAEAGGTVFKDDQQVFESGVRNPGNRETAFLGQRLFLTELRQAYGVRGSGAFTKFLFASNALSWLDLHGQLFYSRPSTDTSYLQFNAGNFAVSSGALFVAAQQAALASTSRMPHTSAGLGGEVRPFQRTRVLVSWMTDRLENKGANTFNSILSNDYSQADADVIVDATRQLTLRGGYRYLWGDGRHLVTPQTGLAGAEESRLRRYVGKAGLAYRPAVRLSINADLEAASAGRVYFRTSLGQHQKVRFRARYQASGTLTFSTDFGFLKNQNALAGNDYDFEYRNSSVGVHWTPAAVKQVQVDASYSRSTIRSDNTYIAPQFFERERSFYRDNAHTVDGRIGIALPGYGAMIPRLSLGGTFFFSSGSRPTQHYQPLGALTVPISNSVAWISEWRYHGFGETFYGFEAFRTHLIQTGIRVSR